MGLVVGTLSDQAVDLLPGLHPGRLLGQLGSAEQLDQGALPIGGQVPEVVLDGDPFGRLVALRVVERRLLQLAAGPGLHGPLLGGSACFFPVLDAERVPLRRLEHLVVVGGQGGARHRGVRPLPGGTLGSHHQGDVGGHPLGLVHGQRVAAVDGVVVGGVEGQLTLVGALQGERLALDIDRGDHATGAVADRTAALVGETDDTVADLILLVTDGECRTVDSPLATDRAWASSLSAATSSRRRARMTVSSPPASSRAWSSITWTRRSATEWASWMRS